MNLNKYKLLAGDASFRKFYRSQENSIIVYSKKNKYLNLVIYEAINRCLNKNRINTPKLKKEFYNKNYIEIEDLGKNSLLKLLKGKKNKNSNYLKIIRILKLLQKIKTKSIKTFNQKNYKIPDYSRVKILGETNLFIEWYLPKVCKNDKIIKSKIELKRKFVKIYKKLQLNNKVFVHRDFHVSNMMLYKKKIYLIDNQDAAYGNMAYDLASLIDDVRLKTSKELKEKVFNYYMQTNKKIQLETFKKDFEILSILRNLKIIGIFMRLAIRDNKKKYVRLIPYAWEMLNFRIKKQREFENLMLLLKDYFPKFIR